MIIERKTLLKKRIYILLAHEIDLLIDVMLYRC